MATTTTYGRWAALRPANTSEAELLLAGAADSYIVNIQIANQDTVAREYSVALTDASGAATGEDWLAKTSDIEPGRWETLKAVIAPTQSLRVQASAADVISFVVFGMKITTS
jgi:hypothetical protein